MKKTFLFLTTLLITFLAQAQIAVPTLDNTPIYGLENVTVSNGTALVSDIQKATRFYITSPDGATIEQVSFKVIFTREGVPAVMFDGKGNILSEAVIKKMQELAPGDRVIIEGISFKRAHEETLEELRPLVISVN